MINPLLYRRRRSLLLVSTILAFVVFHAFYDGESLANRMSGVVKQPQRKELVVASIVGEDTSWIEENLPDWGRNVYVTDDPGASLTVPVNKGHEAMVYLTYVWRLGKHRSLFLGLMNAISLELIWGPRTNQPWENRFIIDNYLDLPEFMVFMHSLRYQWHNDDPIYGIPSSLTPLTHAPTNPTSRRRHPHAPKPATLPPLHTRLPQPPLRLDLWLPLRNQPVGPQQPGRGSLRFCLRRAIPRHSNPRRRRRVVLRPVCADPRKGAGAPARGLYQVPGVADSDAAGR